MICSKQLNEKRVLFYTALLFESENKNRSNIAALTSFCGFSLDRHKNGALNQYRKIAHNVSRWLDIKWEDTANFTFTVKPVRYYGIIYREEFITILGSRKNSTRKSAANHAVLLLVLSYVRSHMDSRPEKPNTHFTFLKTIANDLGISPRSVSTAIKVLTELEILHVVQLPHYYYKSEGAKKWNTAVSIFANDKTFRCNSLQPNDWQADIQRTIELKSV